MRPVKILKFRLFIFVGTRDPAVRLSKIRELDWSGIKVHEVCTFLKGNYEGWSHCQRDCSLNLVIGLPIHWPTSSQHGFFAYQIKIWKRCSVSTEFDGESLWASLDIDGRRPIVSPSLTARATTIVYFPTKSQNVSLIIFPKSVTFYADVAHRKIVTKYNFGKLFVSRLINYNTYTQYPVSQVWN